MTRHQTIIKVRGYHLDVYQHVNNARYLEFLEEARWRFFDELGVSEKMAKNNLAFIIIKIEIDFRHEARINDELAVFSHVASVRKSKMAVTQKIYLKETNQLIAGAEVSFVLTDRKNNCLVSVSTHFSELTKLIDA